MLPDRVSNPGPLTYESGALPIELRGLRDSNEYTQYTIINMKKKNTLHYPKSAAMGFFPRDSRMSSKQPW